MAVRTIVTWPDPVLREPTRPIESANLSEDEDVRALYRDLVDTMYAYSGVGIAAIQIGDLRQMFVIEAAAVGGSESDDPLAFINPEISWQSDEKERADEGCLSFPGVFVPIERSTRARVRALNLAGESFELEGEGLLARAFQHELDHLTGRLVVDFVGPLKQKMIRRKLKRDAA